MVRSHSESYGSREVARGVALPVVGVLAAAVLSGCGLIKEAEPDPRYILADVPCAVYDTDANELHPTAYPEGDAYIEYAEPFAYRLITKGVITRDPETEEYELDIKGIPGLSEIIPPSYERNPNAAIFVSSETMGKIGISLGCMEEGLDANGFPAMLVELPVYQD